MRCYFLHPILKVKSIDEDKYLNTVIANTIDLLFSLWGFNNEIDNNSYSDTVLNREPFSLEEHH